MKKTKLKPRRSWRRYSRPTTRRTHVCRIRNHQQVREALDRHGWSASKLWNVANYHAGQEWDDTGEIPGESKEELSEAFISWFNSDENRDNPPGYRKQNYYDDEDRRVHEEHPRCTVTWKANGFRHDRRYGRFRLSKGRNHKPSPRARDYILVEYDAPPEVELENVQQVRAVWNTRKHRWELYVVCKHEIAADPPGDRMAGVDLGICNTAVVALPDDALLYPGNTRKEDMHYFTQREYDTEGENGPRNEGQRLRETLSGRVTHFLHALGKDIVGRCADHDVGTLVIGDLTGINEQDWSRHGNKRLDNWPYARLTNLIDYKARERGIEVEIRDERDTSTTCSVCGHKASSSRIERGLWKYGRCGVVANGDVNGADNIRQLALTATPPLGQHAGDSGAGCLAQPRVIHFSRIRGFVPRESAG